MIDDGYFDVVWYLVLEHLILHLVGKSIFSICAFLQFWHDLMVATLTFLSKSSKFSRMLQKGHKQSPDYDESLDLWSNIIAMV